MQITHRSLQKQFALANLALLQYILCITLLFNQVSNARQVTRQFKSDQSNSATLFTSVNSVSVSSKLHCASLCAKRFDCLTFLFSPDTSMCHLSNEEPGGLGSGVETFSYGLRRLPKLSQCKRLVAAEDGRLFCTIQQRVSNSVSFQQSWTNYEIGFGNDVNFWIGLQTIHQLSNPFGVKLLVDIVTWSNQEMHQEYFDFTVQADITNYTMFVGSVDNSKSNFNSNKMAVHNGMMFSTTDRDNDIFPGHCSNLYHGSSGWWFSWCAASNPNGIYFPSAQVSPSGIGWSHNGSWVTLKATRLMLHIGLLI